MKKSVLLFVGVVLVVFFAKISLAEAHHYVYPGFTQGNNDGSSWDNAWRSFADINWAALQSE